MIPIGVGVVWVSYTVGIWGYCLVRGYNVTFRQLFAAQWPAGGQTLQQAVNQAEANFQGAAAAAVAVGQRASGQAPKAGG